MIFFFAHHDNTLKQIKKNCKTQKWDHNYRKVLKITRIFMHILIPKDFRFQRNLHLQFPPFWIQISLQFRESSMKFCHALRNSTLNNRYQHWHLRFDWIFLVKNCKFCWDWSKIGHFGEFFQHFFQNAEPSLPWRLCILKEMLKKFSKMLISVL